MGTYKTVALKLTPAESKLIRAGAAALGVSKSTLIASAAEIAAHDLGFYEDGRPVELSPGAWKDAPIRKWGDQGASLVISLNPLEYGAVREAAKWNFVPLSTFLAGATFRFLAKCKAAHPENKALAKLRLPKKYESPLKRGRSAKEER